MDSGDSKNEGRTTRSKSAKQKPTQGAKETTRHINEDVAVDESEDQDQALHSKEKLTRYPIKRTRKMREDHGAPRAVNRSKEPNSLTEKDEDESPVKKQKLEEKRSVTNEKGDGLNQIDDVDMDTGENNDNDEAMDSDEEGEQDHESSLTAQPGTKDTHPAHVREADLEYEVSFNRQSPIRPNNVTDIHRTKAENYKPVTKYADASRESDRLRRRNNINYPYPATEKHKNPASLGDQSRYLPSASQKSCVNTTIQLPIVIQTANHKNTELRGLQKPVTLKASPASSSSSKGWTRYMWCLIPILLLALGFCGFWACQKFYLPPTGVVHFKTVEKFDPQLKALQALFPSQRSEFWKRSGKHIRRHLETVNPTEPVSVILTAGLHAERTLGCLARSLAAEYSATHNASVLEINGITKRAQDSDQVKLDIDEELKEAFEGDKPAAVVHRFEELPPGSTLIFYRYCDHENAAYKNVFLVFTVMLSVEEIAPTTTLSEVEGMVHDHVKQKFVTSDKSTMFNRMDVDKLSGLWSRISHVILPVAAEEKIEQQGCGA